MDTERRKTGLRESGVRAFFLDKKVYEPYVSR